MLLLRNTSLFHHHSTPPLPLAFAFHFMVLVISLCIYAMRIFNHFFLFALARGAHLADGERVPVDDELEYQQQCRLHFCYVRIINMALLVQC